MNIEEIKVGERYNVCGCIGYKNEDEISITFECKPGVYCSIPFAKSHASMYFSLPPTPPKYDPCRPFKVGDEVRYCAPDGRIYADRGSLIEHIKNRDFTRVIRDELPNGKVGVFDPFDEENPYYVPAHALKLVTPVEELEPYSIDPETTTDIFKDGEWYAHVCDGDEAEHLCQWLNEKHRKEHQND